MKIGLNLKQGLLEAALIVAWSSSFIGAVLATETSSFSLVLFWRFIILAVLLLPFVVSAIRRGVRRRDLLVNAGMGGLAMFACIALHLKAIDLGVAAGTLSLVAALQPLATAALAGPLLGDVVRRSQWLGLLVGFAGVMFAVGADPGEAPPWAYAVAIAGTMALVAATLLAKAKPTTLGILPGLGIQSMAAAVLYAPLAAYDGTLMPVFEWDFLWALAWLIVFATFGGFGLYWLCLRSTSATRVGTLLYMSPPVTMVWAWAMFGQPVTVTAMTGFGFCLLGLVLARERPSRPLSLKPSGEA